MSKEDKFLDGKENQDDELLEDSDLEEGEKEGNEKKERVFTQKQVNKMLAKEKSEMKSAILKELGLDDEDNSRFKQFTSFLKDKGSKSKEEKEDKVIKEMGKRIKELEERNIEAELKNSILENGINKKYVSVASLLIKQKMEEDDLEDIMDDLKKSYPEWFEEEQKEEHFYGTGRQIAKSNIKKSNSNSSSSISARLIEARKQEQQSSKKSEGWKTDF